MISSKVFTAAMAAACLWASAAPAETYPSRPVELLVPFPAGGGSDVLARAFAEAARRTFPQPLTVINKPGAIGSIGFYEGGHAKADGYKITVLSPELLLAPLIGIGKASYEDFTVIAKINSDPSAITVRANAPWKTIEEFIADARARPGAMTVGNSGNGSIYHVAAAAFEEQTKIKVNHVPYQGSAPAVLGLLGAQVDAATVTPGEVSTYVKAGQLRVLAVMSDQRVKGFENVPTFKERGYDLRVSTWRGIAVPKGTSPEIVRQLSELAQKVNQEPVYRNVFEKQNLGLVYEDAETFRKNLQAQNEQFKRLVPGLILNK